MGDKQNRINICPRCGGDTSSIQYGDYTNNKCPYCGHEIYDYSEELNQGRIRDVEEKRKKLLGLPRMVAVIIIVTILVMFGAVAVYYLSGMNYAIGEQMTTGKGKRYTKKMADCYDKKDWNGLYDIVILDSTNAMQSSYYFTYRTAWKLSYFPNQFDEASKKGDIDKMKEAYDYIKSDYDMRQDDMFYSIYGSVDEIEDALMKEYERETEIMNSVEDK